MNRYIDEKLCTLHPHVHTYLVFIKEMVAPPCLLKNGSDLVFVGKSKRADIILPLQHTSQGPQLIKLFVESFRIILNFTYENILTKLSFSSGAKLKNNNLAMANFFLFMGFGLSPNVHLAAAPRLFRRIIA